MHQWNKAAVVAIAHGLRFCWLEDQREASTKDVLFY